MCARVVLLEIVSVCLCLLFSSLCIIEILMGDFVLVPQNVGLKCAGIANGC